MKLRERITICFCVTFVLLTLLLIVDLQFDIGYSKTRILYPTNTLARHGRFYIDNEEPAAAPVADGADGADGAGSAIGTNDEKNEKSAYRYVQPSVPPPVLQSVHDAFDDLAKLASSNEQQLRKIFSYVSDPIIVVVDETKFEQTILEELTNISSDGTLQAEFHKKISKRHMYEHDDPLVEKMLKRMRSDKIVRVKEKDGGTQLKLIIEYENGDRALFKPMRFPREQQTLANHFYFTDYERHNAEIASFHLDRVLGFRRAMPVTGRKLNLTSELYNIGDPPLLKTFFISPANNYCFHGHCSYYCDTGNAVCGNPDILEGSFAAYLPERNIADRTLRKHPWRRSYHKRKKATWENDPYYCEAVKISPPYDSSITLLDLVDTSIFDFFTGNMDRHHFETFSAFGNNSFPIHSDHGRGFGRPFHDEMSILAPLSQCCIIKQSTLQMLLKIHNGEKKLGDLLRASLAWDPLRPVLWEPHYAALDRRVKIVLDTVRMCVDNALSLPNIDPPRTTDKSNNRENEDEISKKLITAEIDKN